MSETESNLIAPGEYLAKATDWGFGYSKNMKQQLAVDFIVNQPGPHKNWHVTKYFYFSDGALSHTMKALRIMGWTGEALEEVVEKSCGLDKNEVKITVAHEEYDGKVVARVEWVNEAGGVRLAAPMTREDILSFSADMKKKIKIEDAKRGADKRPAANGGVPSHQSKAPEPPPAMQPPSDDDIPF